MDEVADTGRRSRFLLTVAGSADFFFGFGPTRLLFAIPNACLSPHGQPAQPLAGNGASRVRPAASLARSSGAPPPCSKSGSPLIPDREWYSRFRMRTWQTIGQNQRRASVTHKHYDTGTTLLLSRRAPRSLGFRDDADPDDCPRSPGDFQPRDRDPATDAWIPIRMGKLTCAKQAHGLSGGGRTAFLTGASGVY